MQDSPCTRRRVVVTMTRGDETARRLGDPLSFDSLGRVVLDSPGRPLPGEATLASSADRRAIYRLRRLARQSIPTGR